jgi:hypothetical protein
MQKTIFTFLIMILAGSYILSSGQVQAQDNIVKEVREVPDFSGIDVGGAFDILLSQADVTKVVIETEKENLDKIHTIVKNGVLEISSKSIKKSDKLNVYITTPKIDKISIHGAADLKGLTGIHGTELVIRASGASDTKLDVDYDKVNSNVSGAASLVLSGKTGIHTIVVSGAGDVNAGKLLTEVSSATVSGAGSARVNAVTEVVSNTSGAGTIDLVSKPETLTIVSGEIIGESENIRVQSTKYGDTTKVRIAGIRVEVIDNDSTRITIGNRRLTVDENGNVKWCKVKIRKFNGHWAGVELGVNGYLTKDYDMKFSPEDEYMDLRMEKSLQVNLNIYEQNIALSKNQEWGMLSGIGLSWNNYRFRRPTTLNPDSSYLIGYIDEGISVRKSKLAIAYLQIPLIFEWQNHTLRKRNSFHVGLGVVLGVRLWSWQKKYYNELNKEYTLTQYDPASGQYIDVWKRTSPNYSKTKTYDDFHLQPFKADATLRIGWGYINLFATYNLVPMFRKDKGPDLHQFAAGITLLGW